MRMFMGIAAVLTVAGGAAVTAVSLAQQAPAPRVWVSKDGTSGAVITGVAELDDDDQPGDDVRQLAVLAGRGAQLGVSVRDLDADAAAKGQNGAVVEDVRTGSAAEKAGIKKGDVISDFDGERVRSARHLSRLVTETADGRTVKATVMREGKRVDLSVTPDSGSMASLGKDFDVLVHPKRFEMMPHHDGDFTWSMPAPPPDGAWAFKGHPGDVFGFRMEKGRLGLKIQPLDGQLGEYFGTAKGVLVNSVDADSPAAKAGLKAGDVVTAINGKPVTEPSELIDAVRDVEDGATLSIDFTRDRKPQSAKATLEKAEPKELPRKRQYSSPI